MTRSDGATAPVRTSKRFHEKREALIASAIREFNQKGVTGTTLAEIGASLNMIKTGVTYYFRRKEDLAEACFLRAVDALDGVIDSASGHGDVRERIRAVITATIELHGAILAGQHAPLMSFNEVRELPTPQRSTVFDAYTGMFRKLRDLLRGTATQHWSRDELNARTHLLLSHLHALGHIVDQYEPEDRARLALRIGDIVLDGIRKPDAVWSGDGLETAWLSELPERDLPNQFLQAATVLINEQGYAGTSIAQISERLNLTKGGFYYYHDNKSDMVWQCFERTLATLRKGVNLTERQGGSAWEHLCAIARGLVAYQLSPDGPLLRSAGWALPDAEQRAQVTAEFGRIRERVSGIIVTGMVEADIRPLDPKLAAHLLLVGIMAAAELKRWVHSADPANARKLYARPLIMGLLD